MNSVNTNKIAVFLIFTILIVVLTIVGCKSILNNDDIENTSTSNSDIAIIEKTETSETQITHKIPICFNENKEPVRPAASISGTEYAYKDSYIISNPEDITCIVNKTYNLSEKYEAEDLVRITIPFAEGRTDEVKYLRKEASEALTKMYEAACAEGYEIFAASGYRSYAIQRTLFSNKIAEKGSVEAANEYSAMPGQSEHQLGLAVDLSLKSLDYKLNEDFGKTEEGKWLYKNAYKFGFILRYPEDKTDITGYNYEPWHFRYVGDELSKYLYENRLTLEEYYDGVFIE